MMPDEMDAIAEMLDDAGKFEAWSEGKEPAEVQKAERPKTSMDRLQEDLAYAAPEMWMTHVARRVNEIADDNYEKALDDVQTVWDEMKTEAGDGAAYIPDVDRIVTELLNRVKSGG